MNNDLYNKTSLESYLNYVQNKLESDILYYDEYQFYKKAEIVTKHQLLMVENGWNSDDIAKTTYLMAERWLNIHDLLQKSS
jgi:hypothetical protein